MIPYVMEPVPDALIPYISGPTESEWAKKLDYLVNLEDREFRNDAWMDMYWSATELGRRRTLDSAYLISGPDIRMWSDEAAVSIEWDNRERLFDGMPAWSAVQGAHTMSKVEFVREFTSFHARLMDEMVARLRQVVKDVLPTGVFVDLGALEREHESRSHPDDRAFLAPHVPTDWREVAKAIQYLERDYDRRSGRSTWR